MTRSFLVRGRAFRRRIRMRERGRWHLMKSSLNFINKIIAHSEARGIVAEKQTVAVSHCVDL